MVSATLAGHARQVVRGGQVRLRADADRPAGGDRRTRTAASRATSIISGDNMVVAKYSKNQDLAFALVKMLTSAENQVDVLQDVRRPADQRGRRRGRCRRRRAARARSSTSVGRRRRHPVHAAPGATPSSPWSTSSCSRSPRLQAGGVSDVRPRRRRCRPRRRRPRPRSTRPSSRSDVMTDPVSTDHRPGGRPAARGTRSRGRPRARRRRTAERAGRPLWMLLPAAS